MKVKIWFILLWFAGMPLWSSAALEWSAGDLFGADEPSTILDPDTGLALAQGSLVLLIYDSDNDGSDGDIDLLDGSPINGDVLVSSTTIGSGGFIPFVNGGVSSSTDLGLLNNTVGSTSIADGESGLLYIRVFNVPDPTSAGMFYYGDSLDTNPDVVDPTDTVSPSVGGGYLYTEQVNTDIPLQWTAGLVTLDTKVPEPSTFLMVLLGALGLGLIRRRRNLS